MNFSRLSTWSFVRKVFVDVQECRVDFTFARDVKLQRVQPSGCAFLQCLKILFVA